MRTSIRPAIVFIGFFTLLTGVMYPLAMTAVAQFIAPYQANGSLITRNGQVSGSALIGQRFTSDRYFHGRPSAAGQDGYDASASSGSNLGPLSKALLDRVTADVSALHKSGLTTIPADSVTASASGLDPQISPEYAVAQVTRVAAARGLPAQQIRDIVNRQIENPVFGIFGMARINVLRLNMALDAAPPAGAG
jgi:K+-transporting ATPase ATPase C chain